MTAGRIEHRSGAPLAALLEVAAEARAESLEEVGTPAAAEEVRLLGALSDPTADISFAIEALSDPAVVEQMDRALEAFSDQCDHLAGLEAQAPLLLPPREFAMLAVRLTSVTTMARTIKKLVHLKREARKRQRGRSQG